MSEIDLIDQVRELGLAAVSIYMLFRIENRIIDLITKFEELCNKIGGS